MSSAADTIKKQIIRDRQVAYQQVFGNPDDQAVKAVINDLRHFCRADETTFLPDARAHALLEGRREVWLRIESHLKLKFEQLFNLHTKGAKE